MNPRNTVFDAKRLIGRKFDDPKIQADMKHWSFDVVNESGLPKIAVEYKGERKIFAPEEISSMVLTKMREVAEVYLGGKVCAGSGKHCGTPWCIQRPRLIDRND